MGFEQQEAMEVSNMKVGKNAGALVLNAAFIFAIASVSVQTEGQKYEPVNPNLSPEAREVFNFLRQVYGKRLLSGYNVYVHTPDDFHQTGLHGAVWGRDLHWLGDPQKVAEHAIRHGYILTIHWHWHFNGDSAWKQRREKPVDVGRVVTPGTSEYEQLMKELDEAADKLEVLKKAKVPVLFRPLHEIDGGWFWWTDTNQPENTAKLWRIMFDHFAKKRGLNNLIWVYNMAHVAHMPRGRKEEPINYRRKFYPGSEYVDIASIDIYGVDVRGDEERYREHFQMVSQVAPGKMIAMAECDDMPDPEKIQRGLIPIWLYAMPWWGCPSGRRTVKWATYTMSHDLVLTLKDLPAFSWAKPKPHIGILYPRDDGSAWFTSAPVEIKGYAVDRDGKVERIEFLASKSELDGLVGDPPYERIDVKEERIGVINNPPKTFLFKWKNPPVGCYTITAVAYDNEGNKSASNAVRTVIGLTNAAKGKKVWASSGEHPEFAVDGDYYTSWVSEKGDEEWLIVDLGRPMKIDRVNLLWSWKIHAVEFTVDVAETNPEKPASWHAVYSQKDLPWIVWKATYRIQFKPVTARYVRLSFKKRPRGQTWGGYNLLEIEIPVPLTNHVR